MTSPQSAFSDSSVLALSKRPSIASQGSPTSVSSYELGTVPLSAVYTSIGAVDDQQQPSPQTSPRSLLSSKTLRSPNRNPSTVTFSLPEDASRPRLPVESRQSILKKPDSPVSGLAGFRLRRQSSLSKGSGIEVRPLNNEPQCVQTDFAPSEQPSLLAHQNISIHLSIPSAYSQLMHHDSTSGIRVAASLVGLIIVMVAAALLYYYVRVPAVRDTGSPRPVPSGGHDEESYFDQFCLASGVVDSNKKPSLAVRAARFAAEGANGKGNGSKAVENISSAIAQELVLVRESKSPRFKVTTEPLPFSNITLWNTSNPRGEFGYLNEGGKPWIRSIQLDRLATATPLCLKHPYVALIRFDSANCSGGLIDDRVVLTSASCFMSRRPRDPDIMQTTDFAPVSQSVTVHLNFTRPGLPCTVEVRSWQAAAVYVHTLDDERDIAVVLLKSVNMSMSLMYPTCLAAQSDDLPDQPSSCEVVDFFVSDSASSSTLGPQVENSPTWTPHFNCSETVAGSTKHTLNSFLSDKYCCKTSGSLNGSHLCGGNSGGILMCTPKGQHSWKQFGIVPPSVGNQSSPNRSKFSSMSWATSVVYHRQWLELMALPMLHHFDFGAKKLQECQFRLCTDWIARSFQSGSPASSKISRARSRPRRTGSRRQSQSKITDSTITTTDLTKVDDFRTDELNDNMTRSAICRWLQGYVTCRRLKSRIICDSLLNILNSTSMFSAYDRLLKTFNGDEHLTACHRKCNC